MINKDELIDKIKSAFQDIKLGNGISLNMTEYYDSGDCEPKFKELAINLQKNIRELSSNILFY